ncbi:tetratricopeptide repeat protein [Pseudacidovorax intermedius]|uniref:O-linked N-acetylglucosamine transferase, SPINDLY family protein n=1 Tax=Pseudacidovorax intermedius TaxID=433924 RepID=UPI000734B2F5|nr:tetratricopeptide repeat protein [Pseudacidovorax intermedius]
MSATAAIAEAAAPTAREAFERAREAVDRALAEVDAHRLQAALQHFSVAIGHDPKHVDAWLHMGRTFLRLENWANAAMCLETTLALQPGHAWGQHGLAFAHYNSGRRDEALALIDAVCARTHDSAMWQMRAYMHSHAGNDAQRALAVYRDWGARFADPLTRAAAPLVVRDRRPDRRLRVGYVSGDLRRHSIAFFMAPVFGHHDASQVEVHAYSVGPQDEYTEALKTDVPHWHDVRGLDDEALTALIRSHGIDVLVDLSGHTEDNRLLVFARRAAPVQVTWLGFMHPLGMKAMDYRIVDAAIAPPGHEAFYSERLFRVPCMASYTPPPYAPLCQAPPMLRKGHPTLISLNNSAKITDAMLALWARILAARPEAQLIVMVKERTPEAAQAAMQARVEAAGLPLERTFVMHQQPLEQFMELGHVADLALDTAPISGGTTTLHALWMGLPVIAMDGERGVDACTARTLQGLGLHEDVATDEDGYVAAALRRLDDPDGLLRFRQEARARMLAGPLMDYAARTRELEQAFRSMWLNWLEGSPRRLDLDTATAVVAA